MKKSLLIISLGIVSAVLLNGCSLTQTKNTTDIQGEPGFANSGGRFGMGSGMGRGQGMGAPNRNNCLGDDCLLVEDLDYPVGELPQSAINALDEAISDEYKAWSVYNAVIDEFGSSRPFSMIIRAEEQHISSLKAIYDKYGLEAPENEWMGKIDVPESLTAACQLGVDAEIANAALYRDSLLPAVTEYEDITAVFTSLINASQQKHLPAFERCN